jgi:hypothetical protein
MPSESAAWTLAKIEPPDNTFRDSDEEVHRAFWKYIADLGVDRFHWRCNAGLDRHGADLTPIAASTRARGRKRSYTGLGNGNNPPLVPALGLSRTEALLKGRGFADHAEWHWRTDPVTGLHWGQVMLWHRAGGGGRYPQRDVIGWSREDILWLHRQGATWWYAHQHGQRVAEAMNLLESRADKFPRLPAAAPVKIAAKGRMDIEHFTFGIGATENVVRRSIEEGTFSGFSKAGRYKPPGPGGKAKPAPKPTIPFKPKPKPAPAPAKVRRPAAIAKASEPIQVIAEPKPKPGEAIPARPAARARKPKPASPPAKPAWVNPYIGMPKLNPLQREKTPPVNPAVDLAAFAARAKAAARKVKGRFGGEKVWISQAHSAYVKDYGPISLVDYKDLLGRSLQSRHLDLSRADMAEAFDLGVQEASETFHPIKGHEFHFFNLD